MKQIKKILLALIIYPFIIISAKAQENDSLNRIFFSLNSSIVNSRSGEVRIENGTSYRFFPDYDNQGIFAFDNYVMINYFIVPQWISAGIGTGFFRSFNPNFNLIPLIADLRAYIYQDKNALFLYLQYGYSYFKSSRLSFGGFMGIGIGYHFRLFDQKFNIELGARGRSASFDGERPNFSRNKATVRGANLTISYILY